jgi:4'-phosphopantetheinyl transferase EntD
MANKPEMPDAIYAWWFVENQRDGVFLGLWSENEDKRDAKFLRATPCREAAPDMLDALRAMRDDPTVKAVCRSPLWAQMVDAIAKAEGR